MPRTTPRSRPTCSRRRIRHLTRPPHTTRLPPPPPQQHDPIRKRPARHPHRHRPRRPQPRTLASGIYTDRLHKNASGCWPFETRAFARDTAAFPGDVGANPTLRASITQAASQPALALRRESQIIGNPGARLDPLTTHANCKLRHYPTPLQVFVHRIDARQTRARH